MKKRIALIVVALATAIPIFADEAVMVIDMQDYFVHFDEPETPANQRIKAQAIRHQVRLIQQAQDSGLWVIYVLYDLDDLFEYANLIAPVAAFETNGYQRQFFLLKDRDNLMAADNRYRQRNLEKLQSRAIDKLFVIGANGDACVRDSIVSLMDHGGYQVHAVNNGIVDLLGEDYINPFTYTRDSRIFRHPRVDELFSQSLDLPR